MKDEYREILNELESQMNNEAPNTQQTETTEEKQEVKQEVVSDTSNVEQEAKEEVEETTEEIEANEETKPKRTPREPKLVEAWRVEIEKKKLLKKAEAEKQELLNQLNELRSQFEEFKKTHTQSQILREEENVESKIKSLAEKYNIDEGFLKDIYETLRPKVSLPKEFVEKLAEIDRIKEENRIKQEDLIFENEFNRYVVPKLKEKYSDLTNEEIEKVKEVVKNDYFSEKYITLEIDEIYKLNSDKYEKFISPRKYSVESKSKPNVSRDAFVEKDYTSLTEEDFLKMSDEEKEEAIRFLTKGRIK